ncbi:hypothetical protein H072_1630 [Dactylellina haptotyla CBS 200.50]|uniref:Uncharacterized protein n=1 Tax=Dactylellina haptotyla (strain CBS 200.50) TaxID=1284197 RepID=S8ATW2_DACHA|nr:hypothetical protein H072_1630 [Dactylellina haptotyla CBS 200.50]
MQRYTAPDQIFFQISSHSQRDEDRLIQHEPAPLQDLTVPASTSTTSCIIDLPPPPTTISLPAAAPVAPAVAVPAVFSPALGSVSPAPIAITPPASLVIHDVSGGNTAAMSLEKKNWIGARVRVACPYCPGTIAKFCSEFWENGRMVKCMMLYVLLVFWGYLYMFRLGSEDVDFMAF